MLRVQRRSSVFWAAAQRKKGSLQSCTLSIIPLWKAAQTEWKVNWEYGSPWSEEQIHRPLKFPFCAWVLHKRTRILRPESSFSLSCKGFCCETRSVLIPCVWRIVAVRPRKITVTLWSEFSKCKSISSKVIKVLVFCVNYMLNCDRTALKWCATCNHECRINICSMPESHY